MAERFVPTTLGMTGAALLAAGVFAVGSIGGEGDPLNLYTQHSAEEVASKLSPKDCPTGDHLEFNPLKLVKTGTYGRDVLLRGTPLGSEVALPFISGETVLHGRDLNEARVLGTMVLNNQLGCTIAINRVLDPR